MLLENFKNILIFYFVDCFFRQGDYNFALQDYHQALDIDGNDINVKNRMSVIDNEYVTTAYQDENYPVSIVDSTCLAHLAKGHVSFCHHLASVVCCT